MWPTRDVASRAPRTIAELDAALADACAEPLSMTAALLALPGTVAGAALHRWAPLTARRHGAATVAAIRAGLRQAGFDDGALDDTPSARARLPIGLPSAVTLLLVAQAYGGRWRALQPHLREDADESVPRATRLALRWGGPAAVAPHIGRLHAGLYDVGAALGALEGGGVLRVEVHGSALFCCPAWQILQLFALEALVGYCGEDVDVASAEVIVEEGVGGEGGGNEGDGDEGGGGEGDGKEGGGGERAVLRVALACHSGGDARG
jgi:uncharacterized membrane protein YgcG